MRFGGHTLADTAWSYRGICGCATDVLNYILAREGFDPEIGHAQGFDLKGQNFTNYDYFDHAFILVDSVIVDSSYLQLFDFLGNNLGRGISSCINLQSGEHRAKTD